MEVLRIMSTLQGPPISSESDMLNDLLDTMRLRHVKAEMSRFKIPWEERISAQNSGFYYVFQGTCQLYSEGCESGIDLKSGDLAVVLDRAGHRICRHALRVAAPAAEAGSRGIHPRFKSALDGLEERTTTLICGRFAVSPEDWHPLLMDLPVMIHLKNQDELFGAWLMDSVRWITREAGSYRPGAQYMLDRIVQTVLAYAVRTHIAHLPPKRGMQLKAAADQKLGRALRLLHDRPEAPWSVVSLAREVGMSRASLAANFTHLMSFSPMKYLRQCRMLHACKLLRESDEGIKNIAVRIGYRSEAAFGNAFKRWARISPGKFRASPSSVRLPLSDTVLSRLGDADSPQDPKSDYGQSNALCLQFAEAQKQ
jgi:AraC-like DNA-binding protein